MNDRTGGAQARASVGVGVGVEWSCRVDPLPTW